MSINRLVYQEKTCVNESKTDAHVYFYWSDEVWLKADNWLFNQPNNKNGLSVSNRKHCILIFI